MSNRQTILGAGGAIGTLLARELTTYTNEIRLVGRNPQKINPGDDLFTADLSSHDAVDSAVEGSDVVYLVAGLKYDLKVWEAQWPVIMRNVIDACRKHGTKLVFFDNIYMYDQEFLDGMTEETPVNPPSLKGRIRARLVKMIQDEVAAGALTALIARGADFYGPSIHNSSMLTETVFKNLAAGKRAMWMGSVKFRHSFTFTPDAAKATAILGNTPDAYNQSWHVPTAPDPFTGKQWIGAIAAALGVKPVYLAAPKPIVRMLGVFVPVMREMVEMIYQYERNYVFNSSKFEKRFNFTPTPYLEGIKQVVETDYEVKREE